MPGPKNPPSSLTENKFFYGAVSKNKYGEKNEQKKIEWKIIESFV